MADLLNAAGQRETDGWRKLAADEALPDNGDIIVPLQCWQDQQQALAAHDGRVGVSLDNTVDVQNLPQAILALPLIALNFPAFTDGRAYSQARLLRERLNYPGIIRACGEVLHDQLFFMRRCGFDSFEWPGNLDEAASPRALEAFSTAYQPTRSGPELTRAGIGSR